MIRAEQSMAEVLDYYPGAALALFQKYRIGSQERYGFGLHERLGEVLARHLVFDHQAAIEFLLQTRDQELELSLSAEQLAPETRLIDVRSAEEYSLITLPGAQLLSAEVMADLDRSAPVVFFCQDATQSPAATRLFRARGFTRAHLLKGGLNAWPDLAFPRLRPAQEESGRWAILPATEMVRYRSPSSWGPAEAVLYLKADDPGGVVGRLLARPEIEKVAVGERHLTVVTAAAADWAARCRDYHALLHSDEVLVERQGQARDRELLKTRLAELLLTEVTPKLKGHKGTIELARLHHSVLGLKLGGGCQGCSSANITIHHEVGALVYRLAPELAGLEDLTDHEAATDPYRGPEPPPALSAC